MFGDDILVRTRLLPPRLPRRWLARERLVRLLSGIVEYPLTVVSASAGYGKSTALSAFAAESANPVAWYTLGESCDDPLVFLVHLIHACRSLDEGRKTKDEGRPTPGDRGSRPTPSTQHPTPDRSSFVGQGALAILQHGSGSQVWSQALDSLVNDLAQALSRDAVLILDDYHRVDDVPDVRLMVERLIDIRPPLLHVVLSTRRRPQLTGLPVLQVRGELLEITEHDLSFTVDEIEQLFSATYGSTITPDDVPLVGEQTGGWAIALQLVWQSRMRNVPNAERRMRNAGLGTEDVPHSLLGTEGREALFTYLAREVLAGQSPEVQSFLLRSSVLSELEPAAVQHVLGIAGAKTQLEGLYRRGLFLAALGNGAYRFHPLFHSFLQEQAAATLPEWKSLHERAAQYYRQTGAGEQVLYHLLANGDVSGAALELEHLAGSWLESGRLVTLLAWIGQLPEETLAAHPRLLIARGDAARLLARFDLAEQSYEQAERIAESAYPPWLVMQHTELGTEQILHSALTGRAGVYLDTVQPARAETLLREAFRRLPAGEREARAELLGLLAENRLNMGRADQALRLLELGSAGPEEGSERIRSQRTKIRNMALVRLGRLAEARAGLEAELPGDRLSVSAGRPSEAHREVTLLLSLIASMEGDPEAALRYAEEGLEAARRLGSTLFEAGAHICMGHALQLAGPHNYRAATEHYLQAMALADAFQVRRTKAEAFMGLALLHGFGGDVAAAEEAAREGLSIAEQSGDQWATAQLWTSLGAVAAANGLSEAADYLRQAIERYRTSKDTYGQAVAHLWLSVRHYRTGEEAQATHHALQAFELARRGGYDGLLTAPTLFGPRDRMMLVPILLAARATDGRRPEPALRSPELAKEGTDGGRPTTGERLPAPGTQHPAPDLAQLLLRRGFPAIAADENTHAYHPGVTLRIQTLGPLRVWRGAEEIGPHEWQRKKAQQLLALLVTNRDHWLLREQICDWLWPDEGQSEAEAQFKVTLNGLNAALEPLRPPRTPPFYIRRQGGAYRFYPPGGVWLDVAEFEARLEAARSIAANGGRATTDDGRPTTDDRGPTPDTRHPTPYLALTEAVELYQGEYLSDWLYEDWARDTRERLEARYIEAATLLAEALVGRGELSEAIRLCELVLARDPGWEDAYRVLMRAYALLGQRSLAIATFERCVRNLREYLDIEPLPSTVRLFEEVKG